MYLNGHAKHHQAVIYVPLHPRTTSTLFGEIASRSFAIQIGGGDICHHQQRMSRRRKINSIPHAHSADSLIVCPIKRSMSCAICIQHHATWTEKHFVTLSGDKSMSELCCCRASSEHFLSNFHRCIQHVISTFLPHLSIRARSHRLEALKNHRKIHIHVEMKVE